MNRPYQVSPAARDDLDVLWDYIARDKPGAATRFLAKLRKQFRLLSRHPLLGESREELLPKLRCFSLGNYVIYFRPLESGEYSIEIVRVLHGGRDVGATFERKR